MHVTPDGTVGVTYYDFRNNTPAAAPRPTTSWSLPPHPPTACASAANWGNEVQLTDVVRHAHRTVRPGVLHRRLRGPRQRRDAFTRVLLAGQDPDPSAPSSARRIGSITSAARWPWHGVEIRPQIPQARTSTSTWPAAGTGSATSSRTAISPRLSTAASILPRCRHPTLISVPPWSIVGGGHGSHPTGVDTGMSRHECRHETIGSTRLRTTCIGASLQRAMWPTNSCPTGGSGRSKRSARRRRLPAPTQSSTWWWPRHRRRGPTSTSPVERWSTASTRQPRRR